jgi:hypothetical protein
MDQLATIMRVFRISAAWQAVIKNQALIKISNQD